MTNVDGTQPGADNAPQEVGEAPVAAEPVVVSPQQPGSDTQIAPTPPEEPSRPAQPPSEQEVLVLRQQLDEQKRIQSGLDRTVAQYQKQLTDSNDKIQELSAQLRSYDAATIGDEGAISDLQAEIERQRQELLQFQQNLESVTTENAQLKVLMGEYMGDNPVAKLVEADALPKATDLDEFRQKMNIAVGGLASAAENQTFVRLHGQRPPASPAGGGSLPSTDELKAKMDKAQQDGDWAEYAKYKDQWYASLNATGLPNEKAGERF